MNEYFKKHPAFNATVHFVGGVGVGFLLASPFANPHPVKWGVLLIGVAVVGHIYAGYNK